MQRSYLTGENAPCKTCICTGPDSPRDAAIQTGCFSCSFLSEIPARKGVFTPPLGFFMRTACSSPVFLLAPTLSPAWLSALLQFLLLLHPGRPPHLPTGHAEVSKWRGLLSIVLSVWNKRTCPRLCHRYNLFQPVSCKHAEHRKAQKGGLNFSSNWSPSPEQFRRWNTHVNKLCWVPEEIWNTKELAEEMEGERHRI